MIERSPSGDRVTGFYRGIVKAHSDNGKCKIFWPGVMPAELENSPEDLPDAEQATSLFMFGSGLPGNTGNGVFSYPEIGSVVWGFFENEDVNRPVYFAGTFMANQENKDRYNLVKNGEAAFYLNSANGNLKIVLNENEEWVSIESSGNNVSSDFESSIKLFKDGGVSISAPNGKVEIDAQSINLHAKTTVSIDSDCLTQVTARERIRIDSKGRVGVLGDMGAVINGSKEGAYYS